MYAVGYVKDRISNESYKRESYFRICWLLYGFTLYIFQISKSFAIILALLFNIKHHLLSSVGQYQENTLPSELLLTSAKFFSKWTSYWHITIIYMQQRQC